MTSLWPIGEAPRVRAGLERWFFEAMDGVGDVAERLRSGQREDRLRFTTGLDNFFRRPGGLGGPWLESAGYHKDQLTAQGKADAFRHAELLADALDAGFRGEELELAALADDERARNAAAGPMYEFTLQLSHWSGRLRNSTGCWRPSKATPTASPRFSAATSRPPQSRIPLP